MSASGTLVELTAAECERLLSDHDFGRVAFLADAGPTIVPVNYVFAAQMIVFRTDLGEKLTCIPMSRVAFEIDGCEGSEPWSVVVRGHAREVTTALGPLYEELREASIPLAAPGAKLHWIAVEVIELTGRAIRG